MSREGCLQCLGLKRGQSGVKGKTVQARGVELRVSLKVTAYEDNTDDKAYL